MRSFDDQTATIDEPNDARMNFRTKTRIKNAIHRAAVLSGVDDSAFTINAAYRAALETIAAHERTALAPERSGGLLRGTGCAARAHAGPDGCRPALSQPVFDAVSETHFVIEPLDVTRHDRAGFSCGVAAVDNFLHRTANKLSKADQMRVFVMTPDGRTIAGFYAINSHAVDYRDLPAALTRQRPNHGSIPAAFISMIGRDRRFHGQGLGGDLWSIACCAWRASRRNRARRRASRCARLRRPGPHAAPRQSLSRFRLPAPALPAATPVPADRHGAEASGSVSRSGPIRPARRLPPSP